MKINTAATGKRRYGLGQRHAPTRGKVNPKGYIKREISNRNKKAGKGKDGLSDRRSGLAKAALRNSKRYVSNRPKPRPTATLPKPANRPNDMRVGTPEALAGTPQPPQIPNISINQNGQLDLPFDEAFGLGLLDQQQSMNSELLNLQQQQQQQAMEFANNQRDLGLQYEDIKRDTLNGNAAQGMAFSSQYAVGASDNARNFNNAQNDLNAWNAQSQSDFDMQRTGIQNAFNDYVRQAVLRQSMDLAGEAGDLGYGISKPEQVWKNKKKAPAKKPASGKKKKLPTKPAKRRQTPTTRKSSKGRKVKKR